MKEYYFAEHLLLRAPARGWRQYFVGEQQHLDDPYLQSAIYLASPQFFDCLKQKQFKFEREISAYNLNLNTTIMETSKFAKFSAEFLGTMVLVLMGCGSAVIAGANGTTGVGLLGISFAFGLSVIAMAYAIGHIFPVVISIRPFPLGWLPPGV